MVKYAFISFVDGERLPATNSHFSAACHGHGSPVCQTAGLARCLTQTNASAGIKCQPFQQPMQTCGSCSSRQHLSMHLRQSQPALQHTW